jgi:hypothetical protein
MQMNVRRSLLSCFAVLCTAAAAGDPYTARTASIPETALDKIVFARLDKLGIQPADPCSDAVFVRRVYLDTIGTLPTAYESREFLLDKNPNKRQVLIARLLEHEQFPSYWAMKWSDLLRVKAEFPINLWPNAVQSYHRWIRISIRDRMPYDQFVRELLTANGSNFRVGPANFYRAVQNKEPEGLAQAVALTFMGCRTDTWPKGLLEGMTPFFAQIAFKPTGEWKEEIVMFDPSLATNAALFSAVFPDGRKVQLQPGIDPREVFADWLVNPRNLWFTQNIVNRAWSWFLGRGIIHEPDDIRDDNPPSNPELLRFLERELIKSNYDLRHLFKIILESRTYQLASIPRSTDPQAEANFAYYQIRRMEAEVLIDALNQVTGTAEKYTSAIPEPFTFLPDNQRSIDLPDGSITSSFLELFGRPARDTGFESERNNRSSAAQRLHMLNSTHIQRKIEQSQMVKYQVESGKPYREVVANVYLGILSRFPTEQELGTALEYAKTAGDNKRELVVDLAWALINSSEFLCRH